MFSRLGFSSHQHAAGTNPNSQTKVYKKVNYFLFYNSSLNFYYETLCHNTA